MAGSPLVSKKMLDSCVLFMAIGKHTSAIFVQSLIGDRCYYKCGSSRVDVDGAVAVVGGGMVEHGVFLSSCIEQFSGT